MKWTKETLQQEALKYSSRKEFTKGSSGAVHAARRLGILDDICTHMRFRVRKKLWTQKTLKEEALKYSTRKEFETSNRGAYHSAWEQNLLDKVCLHMDTKIWTKARICEVAYKYTKLKDFRLEQESAYSAARTKGYFEDCCAHLSRSTNRSTRLIYACEFPDNHVYIGLTWNIKDREQRRNQDDGLLKHKLKSGLDYTVKQLTSLMLEKEASIAESEFLTKYKDNGWIILNKATTGGLGRNSYWTLEKIHKESLKYSTKIEFIKGNSKAYGAARHNDVVDIVCSHMNPLKTKWTKESCHLEALKYSNRREFYDSNRSAYDYALRHSIIPEVCSHMKVLRNTKNLIK